MGSKLLEHAVSWAAGGQPGCDIVVGGGSQGGGGEGQAGAISWGQLGKLVLPISGQQGNKLCRHYSWGAGGQEGAGSGAAGEGRASWVRSWSWKDLRLWGKLVQSAISWGAGGEREEWAARDGGMQAGRSQV